MARTDSKITLFNIRFNLNNYKNPYVDELDTLSDTATNRIQNLNSVTCDIFQLYFYVNLFDANANSKTQDKARLNKKTI